MPVTIIKAKWVDGALQFYNAATGAVVFTIRPEGTDINIAISPSNSPSVSPSASPS